MHNNLKLDLFILTTLVYSAELLADFSYTNFTVSYRDALDRLRVHLNIVLSFISNRLASLSTGVVVCTEG